MNYIIIIIIIIIIITIIVRLTAVLNMTFVYSDWHFDKVRSSHLQSSCSFCYSIKDIAKVKLYLFERKR